MRPNSVPGLFRRLVVLRWQRLSRRSRVAVALGAAALGAAALVSASTCAFGGCPLRAGGCPYSQQASQQALPPAAEAPAAAPAASAESTGCPHAARAQSD